MHSQNKLQNQQFILEGSIELLTSHCQINSGIDTVGVLTQYQPLELNDYIDNGEPWDLDRQYGGVHILPPYQGVEGGDWYKGTANAIYQNMNFIDRYKPDYVIILSGDHIYKMDYNKMLEYHIEKNADCTIAVLSVPMEEASRFGIMNTNEDGRIYEFEEKPKKPKSNKASMGVYIFKKEALFRYLIEDEADEFSSKDFGKNVIPAMLNGGEKMYAYPFEGYWKDVGTLQSLWEGNMDLIGENPNLDLRDSKWKISYRHYPDHPHYIGKNGSVKNSVIAEGCEIYGTVSNSVLFSGVIVEKGAVIKDSVVMSNTYVGEGASVNYSIIDSSVVIGSNGKVGAKREEGVDLTVLGSGVKVKEGAVIKSGEIIEKDTEMPELDELLMNKFSSILNTTETKQEKLIEREAVE